MARHISISISESQDQLQHRLHTTPSPRSHQRLLMLFWLKSEQVSTREEIASRLGCSVATVGRWLSLYRQGGLSALLEIKPSSGHPPAIPQPVRQQLLQRLQSPQGFPSYHAIQQWLVEHFQLELPYSTVHNIVRYQLKAKLKRPRPYSHQRDEQAQHHFQKKLPEVLAFINRYLACGLPLRYFCQDETRWGLKTLGGRVITLQGVKPTLPVQWPREAFYTYGVVEPLTGRRFFFEFSHVDSTCFQLFLDQFAAAFPDSLNVMQLDNGSFHKAEGLEWPDKYHPSISTAP